MGWHVSRSLPKPISSVDMLLSDPVQKAALDEYKYNKKQIEKNSNYDVHFSRSDVGIAFRTVVRVKRKGRLAADADMRGAGVTSLALCAGVPKLEMPDEDGVVTTFGLFPDSGSELCRKLRKCSIFNDVEIYQDEKALRAGEQYREFQARDNVQALRNLEMGKRPDSLRSSKGGWKEKGMVTFEAAVAAGLEKMEAKRLAIQAKAKGPVEAVCVDEQDEVVEPEMVSAGTRRHSSILAAATNAGTDAKKRILAAAKAGTKRVAAKSRSRRKNSDGESQASEASGDDSGAADSDEDANSD